MASKDDDEHSDQTNKGRNGKQEIMSTKPMINDDDDDDDDDDAVADDAVADDDDDDDDDVDDDDRTNSLQMRAKSPGRAPMLTALLLEPFPFTWPLP